MLQWKVWDSCLHSTSMHGRHLADALLAAVLDPGRALLCNVPDALLLLAEALARALSHFRQALLGLLFVQ